MDLQITVAAAENDKVILGFSNEFFSQAIYIPVTDITEMQNLGLGLFNALVTEAEKVIQKRDSATVNEEKNG